jgi:hypothetical protein
LRIEKGHYIFINGVIHQEKLMIVNMYAPKIGKFSLITQTPIDIKGQVCPNRITVGELNTKLSFIERSSK